MVADVDTARRVADLLDGRSLACAESVTAGRIAESFAAVEHAASWFRGGVLPYQVEVKRRLLGVAADSVLSVAAAREMAAGVARLLAADVAVSTTGLAGGEEEQGVAPGTVFIGTYVDGVSQALVHHFDGDPEQVCERARHRAIADLLERLQVGRQES